MSASSRTKRRSGWAGTRAAAPVRRTGAGGNFFGEKIDGIEEKGNGQVAALKKYYVHPLTTCSKSVAEGFAKSIYSGLGAR